MALGRGRSAMFWTLDMVHAMLGCLFPFIVGWLLAQSMAMAARPSAKPFNNKIQITHRAPPAPPPRTRHVCRYKRPTSSGPLCPGRRSPEAR